MLTEGQIILQNISIVFTVLITVLADFVAKEAAVDVAVDGLVIANQLTATYPARLQRLFRGHINTLFFSQFPSRLLPLFRLPEFSAPPYPIDNLFFFFFFFF